MIRKLSILFTILISAAYSKDSWVCDSLGKFKCAVGQTCCRSRTTSYGWACFPLTNAVCCSDGVNVCPSGTICDLTAKTCSRVTLAFLQLPEIQAANYTEPIVNLKPVDAMNFTLGFFEGVEIFTPVLANSTCFKNSEKLVFDVNELVNIFSHFNVEDLAAEIKRILHILEEMVNFGETEIPVCKKLGLDLKDMFFRIYNHVTNTKYVENISAHTIFNLQKIKDLFEDSAKDIQEQVYFRSGKGFGTFLKFAALWDF